MGKRPAAATARWILRDSFASQAASEIAEPEIAEEQPASAKVSRTRSSPARASSSSANPAAEATAASAALTGDSPDSVISVYTTPEKLTPQLQEKLSRQRREAKDAASSLDYIVDKIERFLRHYKQKRELFAEQRKQAQHHSRLAERALKHSIFNKLSAKDDLESFDYQEASKLAIEMNQLLLEQLRENKLR